MGSYGTGVSVDVIRYTALDYPRGCYMHPHTSTREAEGDDTQRESNVQTEDVGLEDRHGIATTQGKLTIT